MKHIYHFAEISSIDFSQLTNEELLVLEIAVQTEKVERKLVKSAKLSAGSYSVGIDIPAGSYTITNDGKYSMNIFVFKSFLCQEKDEPIVNLLLWKKERKQEKSILEMVVFSRLITRLSLQYLKV